MARACEQWRSTMRRHICSTILSLLTCTILTATTGCDVENDETIAADDDEFRLRIRPEGLTSLALDELSHMTVMRELAIHRNLLAPMVAPLHAVGPEHIDAIVLTDRVCEPATRLGEQEALGVETGA